MVDYGPDVDERQEKLALSYEHSRREYFTQLGEKRQHGMFNHDDELVYHMEAAPRPRIRSVRVPRGYTLRPNELGAAVPCKRSGREITSSDRHQQGGLITVLCVRLYDRWVDRPMEDPGGWESYKSITGYWQSCTPRMDIHGESCRCGLACGGDYRFMSAKVPCIIDIMSRKKEMPSLLSLCKWVATDTKEGRALIAQLGI